MNKNQPVLDKIKTALGGYLHCPYQSTQFYWDLQHLKQEDLDAFEMDEVELSKFIFDEYLALLKSKYEEQVKKTLSNKDGAIELAHKVPHAIDMLRKQRHQAKVREDRIKLKLDLQKIKAVDAKKLAKLTETFTPAQMKVFKSLV